MPYRMEYREGMNRSTPFRVYANGDEFRASEEEVAIWEHVQQVGAALEDAKAALADKKKPA